MTHALIFYGQQSDPDVYIGTEAECKATCVRLTLEFLDNRRPQMDRDMARSIRAALATKGADLALKIATEYVENYCPNLTLYLVEAHPATT